MIASQIQRATVLRLKEVQEKTGLSRSTIYNKLNPACKYFDDAFPKPIRLSATPAQARPQATRHAPPVTAPAQPQ